MSNKINNIDDLLRNSFEDFSSTPSPKLRAKVSGQVRMLNFLKFNPGSFNVFYLAAIVLGTSAIILSISNINDSNKKGIYQPLTENYLAIDDENIELGNNTKAPIENSNEKNIFLLQENTPTNSMSEKIQKSSIASNDVINKGISETKILSNYETIKINSGIKDSALPISNVSELQDENSILTNSLSAEKTIIFDTIIETNTIIVTDTIKTQVHKTVELKKNRKNRN